MKGYYSEFSNVINPLKREIINEVIDVGVCSINALHTLGKGQRIAVGGTDSRCDQVSAQQIGNNGGNNEM